MSLIKQVWVLLLATILGAFLASFAVSVVSARGYVETQLRLKNNDTAQSLALSLSQLRGDPVSMELAIAALFDTGHYAEIRLDGLDGQPLTAQRSGPRPGAAPQWFQRLVPLRSPPGTAQVSDGWKAIGTLHVTSQAGFAYTDLWEGSLRSALAFAVLGLLAGAVGTWAVRRLRRPLDATVAQAQALMERRFVTQTEPKVPELRELSRAMNLMVGQVKRMFDEQAGQVERLRREAHCDPLTGVAHRRQFLSSLDSLLQLDAGTVPGRLVLVRVPALAELNRLHGHRPVDEMLIALAQRLGQMAGQGQVGRLNGSDFACCLVEDTDPAHGARAADGLARALKEVLAPLGAEATACAAVVPMQGHANASLLMTEADAVLARAEIQGGFHVEEVAHRTHGEATDAWGEALWRTHLLAALKPSRAHLTEYRVVDRHGVLVHLECPLRLDLDAQAPAQAAAQWLPFALRAGLMPQVDLTAVDLALAAVARDGVPRGVNLARASLRDTSFLPALRRHVEAAPPEVRAQLWLEVPEEALVGGMDELHELCAQMHGLGVRVGLEHAGSRLAKVQGVLSLGLDYVKLDASATRGMAADASQTAYVEGMVGMLHGIGLRVYAEGVSNAEDAQALWAAGVDGQTGPWIKP